MTPPPPQHRNPRPPADCPVCGLGVTVTRLTCEACGTELTGRFRPCGLCGLSDTDVDLVRELLAAGGDTDEVGRRTGLDSQAVRRRLLAAAEHLGHGAAPNGSAPASIAQEGPAPEPTTAADDDRTGEGEGEGEGDDFLERLARGVVEADAALRRLP